MSELPVRNSEIDLDAIRRRVPDVYTGPWTVQTGDPGDDNWYVAYATDNPLAGLVATVPDYGANLAEFIAHAREDVPALIAEVERLRTALAAVESLTRNTDGGDVDPDPEIPVGEIRRVLREDGPQFRPGWLQKQVARSVASLDRLPTGMRETLRTSVTRPYCAEDGADRG
jgi:hypothetical protein